MNNESTYKLSSASVGTVGNAGVNPFASPVQLTEEAPILPAAVAAAKRYSPYALGRYGLMSGSIGRTADDVPNYNPFDETDDSYAPYASLIAQAKSPQDLDQIKQYIGTIKEEKRVANSNIAGNLIGTFLGSLTTVLPGIPFSLGSSVGQSLGRIAAKEAAIGALTDIPIEAALMTTDPEFGLDEAWTGVVMSALGGAIIGPFAHVLSEGVSRSVGHVSTISKDVLHATVQPIEDALQPKTRLTPSGSITPEEYLKKMSEEGLAEAKLPGLGHLFRFFTSGPGSDFQPNVTARLLTSPSLVVRELTNSLVEHGFRLGKTESGQVLNPAAETLINVRTIKGVATVDDAIETNYINYKKAGGQLNEFEFEAEVAKSIRRNGDSAIPEVKQAAGKLKTVLDDYLGRYRSVDIFKEMVEAPKDGEHYFTRVFDRDAIKDRPGEFRQMLQEHLAQVDELRLDADAMSKAVEEIRSKIMGATYFDMDFLTWTDKNTKGRTLHIPDQVLEPFLKNDVRSILRGYISRAERDITLHEKFGTADKTKLFDQVLQDYKARSGTEVDPEKIKANDEQLKQDLKGLEALVDRITGNRGRPKDPTALSSRVFSALMPYNMSRMLGSIAVSMLPEVGRGIVQQLTKTVLRRDLENLGLALDRIKMSKAELKSVGARLEHAQRIMQLAQGEPVLHDMVAKEGWLTAGFRGLAEATAKFSGMEAIDNFNRSMIAGAAEDTFYSSIKAVSEGKANKKLITRLARYGIDPNEAQSYLKAVEKHSEVIDGVRYLNVNEWEGRIGDNMRAAINKYIKSHIIAPGAGDKFLFADANPLAKLMMQFRSYMQGAWGRILLPGLQEPDIKFLATMMTTIGIGYLATHITAQLLGQDTKDKNMLVEAVNRSGSVPYLFDLYATGANVFFGGGTQRMRTQGKLDTLLGPTAGLVSNGIPALSRLATDDLTPSDVRTLKSLIPLNNLIWWNWYLTEKQKEMAASIKAQNELNK